MTTTLKSPPAKKEEELDPTYQPSNTSEFLEIKPQTKVGFQTFDGEWHKGVALNAPSYGHVDVRVSPLCILRVTPDNVKHLFWLNHNPFKSEAQRRYMWKFHPEIAHRWAHGH